MSDLQTSVGIKVINGASEPLQKITSDMKSMSTELQKAGKDSGVAGAFTGIGKGAQEASKGIDGLKGGMSGFISSISPVALGASAIGAGLALLAKSSIAAAQDLQSVGIMARNVFGKDFEGMNKIMTDLSVSLGRNQSDLLKFSTSVTSVATGLGVAKGSAQEMSVGLTKLAIDFGKAFNVADAQAMQALKSALEGNTRGLREFNIVLNDTILQNYLDEKGINRKIETLDEASKALVTYNYLMESTSNIQAAATDNTGNLADVTKQLSAEWGDLKEQMGTQFLPAVTEGVHILTAGLRGLEAGVLNTAKALNMVAAALHGTSQDMTMPDWTPTLKNSQLALDNTMEKYDALYRSNEKLGTGMKLTAEDLKLSKSAMSASGSETKKLTNDMKSLGDEFGKTFQQISNKSKEAEMRHKEAIDGIIGKQKDLYDRLNDLRSAASNTASAFADIGKRFKESMADLNTDREDAVVAQFQKVKDLSDSLQRSAKTNDGFFNGGLQNVISGLNDPASGKANFKDVQQYNLTSDQEQMVNLTLELHREQKALKDYLAENLNLSDKLKGSLQVGSTDFISKVSDLVKQSSPTGLGRSQMSAFTLSMQDIKKRAGSTQEQFDKDTESNKEEQERNQREQQKVKDDIAALDKKRKAVEYAYQRERAEIGYTQVALSSFHSDYLLKMQDMSKVTQETVNNVKVQLEALRNALQQAQIDAQFAAQATSSGSARGSSRAKFADGGVVSQRSGGMDVTVAEGMYNEAIVPLPDGRSIPVRIEGGGQGTSITVQLGGVVIKNDMDANTLVRMITTAIDNQLLKAR